MTNLPHGNRAILDIRKIEEYCLNPTHPGGRHKARVFREALGIDGTNASWLREVLLEAVRKNEAIELATDAMGTRWRIDVPIARHGKRAVVRAIWIVRSGEIAPRFVTCWLLSWLQENTKKERSHHCSMWWRYSPIFRRKGSRAGKWGRLWSCSTSAPSLWSLATIRGALMLSYPVREPSFWSCITCHRRLES